MPVILMYAAIALTGFALGISVTISIAGLMAITKPEMLGMSNSVRMVGNRIGVFVVPFIAGLVATAAGVGSALAGVAQRAEIDEPLRGDLGQVRQQW